MNNATHEGKFTVAVGAVIENSKTGKIFLLQRSQKADFSPGIWEVITGRMRQFEELEDALHREIFEESGLQNFEIIKPLTVKHFYRGEKVAEKELVLIVYWVKTNEEKIIISDEHEDFGWFAPEEALIKIDHPGIKEDLETYIKERMNSK